MTLRPDLIIYNLFQLWAQEAACDQNIEAVLFLTSAAAQNMKFENRVKTESNKETMELLIKNSVSGMTFIQRFYQCVASSSQLILVRTTREIQVKYYNDGSKPSLAVFSPLVLVGPLVHKPQDHVDDDEKIMNWLSKKEAMVYGVPIIAIPMKLDQPINAKLVVDMGVGMEVPRKNKELAREEVASVIRKVVIEEEGKELRKTAKELSGRSKKEEDEEFDEAMEKLVQLFHESRFSAAALKKT
ncbi:hypothetical protein JRO89_XS04G0009400 [Xanthoceras sorbifolium]|uniref:Uncharacterized protein n=1 Tax=Xanthoceras sorbifolium TaxID=99658 RepID=A0ABQ8I3P6_9ROSI|nr:hypothetical protein JRO89_XS04G0009400 [Xanthoceras sorbifolium]